MIDLERSFVHERERPKTNPPASRERHEQRKEKTSKWQKEGEQSRKRTG